MATASIETVEGERAIEIAERLDARASAVNGHPSLGEAVWRDLGAPSDQSLSQVARTEHSEAAFLHTARSDTFAPRHWSLGLVISPDHHDVAPAEQLLRAAAEHVRRHGGGQMLLWVFGPSSHDDARATAAGFQRERDVLQMRVALPLSTTSSVPEGMTVRPFEPGRDEDAWLEVNNRAFENHPEQGGWIADTLARRMAEPWFDPSIFLLAFDARGLVGFNWCKVHAAHHRDPDLGEIFVIGVDPRARGVGLGRALTVIGLGRLADRGIRAGMLFVAADNVGARALYGSLGFATHRRDRAYARVVEMGPS